MDSATVLQKAGYKVYVVGELIDKKAYEKISVTALSTLRMPIGGYLKRRFFNWQLQCIARWVNPDLIIGHGDLLKQHIVYIHNCAHLAHEMIFGTSLPAKSGYGRMHQKILQEQQFSMLVCNSKMMQRDLCRRFKIPKNKSCVLYPRINNLQFSLQKRSDLRKSSREDLMIDDTEILLGIVVSGAFVKRNVSLFIELIDHLRKTHKNLKIRGLIAGSNKGNTYIKKIDSLGLNKAIVVAPSIDSPEHYYTALDIFVLPAIIEEFGLSVVEAMACGNPVVISNMVGASELLSHTSGNAIVSEMNVQKYASSLAPLLNNPKLRQATGQQNAELATNYQPENQLISLIKSLNDNEPK